MLEDAGGSTAVRWRLKLLLVMVETLLLLLWLLLFRLWLQQRVPLAWQPGLTGGRESRDRLPEIDV